MTSSPVVYVSIDEREGMLDTMVNANEWLGQLGSLRAAVLAGDQGLALHLANAPIRYRPWRALLTKDST